MKLFSVSDPESLIDEKIRAMSPGGSLCFAVRYEFAQYYLPGAPAVELVAAVAVEAAGDAVAVMAFVSEAKAEVLDALAASEETPEALRALAATLGVPWLNLSAPLPLVPVCIAKPWGQEIWYTGIEARGQSAVGEGDCNTPLPWLLSLAPRRLLGSADGQPVLLKVLDPLPDEVYGDLYFEMHEQKREVYVVSHVDPKAWPDGTGGIRFGFDQRRRESFGDDAAFRAAYLAAVTAYQTVRREIDERLDGRRREEGIAPDAPLPVTSLRQWQAELAPELLAQEAALRREMEAFTALKPLRVGDLVRVPCRVPHALQHGVRVVEFQTPVYERKILSFAQKVLTQSHWDTAEALERVELGAPREPDPVVLVDDGGVRVEQVALFDDFAVQRVFLDPGSRWTVPPESVSLVMTLVGEARVRERILTPENAVLIPPGSNTVCVAGASLATVLLRAVPRSC